MDHTRTQSITITIEPSFDRALQVSGLEHLGDPKKRTRSLPNELLWTSSRISRPVIMDLGWCSLECEATSFTLHPATKTTNTTTSRATIKLTEAKSLNLLKNHHHHRLSRHGCGKLAQQNWDHIKGNVCALAQKAKQNLKLAQFGSQLLWSRLIKLTNGVNKRVKLLAKDEFIKPPQEKTTLKTAKQISRFRSTTFK